MRNLTTVYVMRDGSGRALYVGCTGRVFSRINQHRATLPWYRDIATIDLEHFENRAGGLARELQLIDDLDPANNVRDQALDEPLSWVRLWEYRRNEARARLRKAATSHRTFVTHAKACVTCGRVYSAKDARACSDRCQDLFDSINRRLTDAGRPTYDELPEEVQRQARAGATS